MRKETKQIVFFFLICFLIGIFSAFFILNNFEINDFSDLFIFYYFLFLMYVAGFCHVIIHEFGHLVCGLLSGYSFVSFRVGTYVLVNQNGCLKLKRFSIFGTGGQCLMVPTQNEVNFKFVLFNLGGSLFNFIFSVLFLILATQSQDNYLNFSLNIFGWIGIILGLINIIPISSTIPNDGHNLITMIKNQSSRSAFYKLLKIEADFTQGKALTELPTHYFDIDLDKSCDTSPLTTNLILYKIQYLYVSEKFHDAYQLLLSLHNKRDKLIVLAQYIINYELIFLSILLHGDPQPYIALQDKQHQNYIKASKYSLNVLRYQYAHQLFDDKRVDADKTYQKFQKCCEISPSLGEISMEKNLVSRLKQQFNPKTN